MKLKYLFIAFFIILIGCFTSCAEPAGSINSSGSGSDIFLVLPVKNTIYLNRTEDERKFYRRSDYLKVLGADLNDSDLIIKIEPDPLLMGPDVNEVINVNGFYEFTQPGNYLIRGTYNGKTDASPISVVGYDLVGGEGQSTVGIEWLP